MADLAGTPQPSIPDVAGAAWIEARYDGGTMPEAAFRVIDATRPPARRAPPRTPTALEAAFTRARSSR
ncbi:hypothetical protein Mrad2831_5196 [Methylobacterium radiotolerans JCM 2831]|uniref:Uncharacterized protein n=1 Tax=Methylobacterium radiotolerans (strain ATCC 27329 / DSM 1819 / JCM 2831 / NBRC 15690 / NCIMB 10815 / 0-1) TaxID=426355 RepID=B1LW90_METRJ|nr:hypothetical protein Mrad2831_5196 [Methylobacterium radiotolerans JCM 2831]GEM98364.1 hypothetical protein MRA01_29040 [Methylobacterium radiotolerans]